MKRFIESQGFHIDLNIINQDNTSTIRLAENGKYSSGKRTRHFDIKYFYITDLINRNEVSIKHCSSNEMLADYHTKPLIGEKFVIMRNKIMNIDWTAGVCWQILQLLFISIHVLHTNIIFERYLRNWKISHNKLKICINEEQQIKILRSLNIQTITCLTFTDPVRSARR